MKSAAWRRKFAKKVSQKIVQKKTTKRSIFLLLSPLVLSFPSVWSQTFNPSLEDLQIQQNSSVILPSTSGSSSGAMPSPAPRSQNRRNTMKDLSGRLGLGLSNIADPDPVALSLDWQNSPSFSIEGLLSLNTSKTNRFVLLGSRYSRNVFLEENLHFFVFGGLALLSKKMEARNRSGLSLEGGAGSRFFLPSTPNLGLSFRAGLKFQSLGGSRIETLGHFGIHYYF